MNAEQVHQVYRVGGLPASSNTRSLHIWRGVIPVRSNARRSAQ
jgi:hypothetical protein